MNVIREVKSDRVGDRYYEVKHPSGLRIFVYPKEQNNSTYAVFGTRYGSVDTTFKRSDESEACTVPAGIAHYLEHKLFESEDGDAFARYAKTGANANAYTSFDVTCYLFSCTENVYESLEILLDFVQSPYFTEQTVQKEQGIIGQEIKMYDDSPDWRVMTAIFGCLYQNHPIRHDIAGTVESIASITPDMLYDSCRAFYNPGNMVLAVAGNVTMEQVLAACERAKLPARPGSVRRIEADEPAAIARPEARFSMQVAKPCLGVGFKEAPVRGVKFEVICDMLTEVICGGMTPLYRTLYDQNLVNPGFDGEFLALDGLCCFMFTGETDQPEKVRDMLLAEIERLRTEGVDEELFTLCKNQLYGEMVQDLESTESAASLLAGSFLRGCRPGEELEALASVTKQDLDDALQTMLRPERSATVVVDPT